MGDYEVKANKAVIKVVANASDATNRLVIEPSNPQALTIGMPVNLNIPKTWSKSLTTRPIRHDWNLVRLQFANLKTSHLTEPNVAWFQSWGETCLRTQNSFLNIRSKSFRNCWELKG